MSAERSYPSDKDVPPPLSLDELDEIQGLAGKAAPDYGAIVRRMWPTKAATERTRRSIDQMDSAHDRNQARLARAVGVEVLTLLTTD